MKKFAASILLLSVLLLAACTPPAAEAAGPTIAPTAFSEETQRVLDLLDEDELLFFDYTTDETIRSANVQVWAYENGQWLEKAASVGDVSQTGNQIAFRFTDSSYQLFWLDDSGHSKLASPIDYADFSATTQQLAGRLEDSTPIALNEEITLWAKIGNSSGSISLGEDFRTADCTTGVAVTITFSDKAPA